MSWFPVTWNESKMMKKEIDKMIYRSYLERNLEKVIWSQFKIRAKEKLSNSDFNWRPIDLELEAIQIPQFMIGSSKKNT